MGLIESLFDITYLIVVIGLGIRLILSPKKGAKLFGWMAILLGVGDAFHLLPRVMAHLSPSGFIEYQAALSWGKFITGITMTVFYLLFYFYYSLLSEDYDSKKKWTIFILAAIRIILILLPQNNWGANENYTMGIIRNIPFLIMGILLIIWTYNKKNVVGLEKMSLLIFLSFLFYIPVVLWVDKMPALGALMIPKTIAYVLIVVQGFKYFIKEFKISNLIDMSLTYLVMGLAGGVFYREFTKYFNYTLDNHLSKIHVHTLVLGFIVLLLMYLMVKNFRLDKLSELKRTLYIYNIGLITTIATMTVYGIYDVVGEGQDTINIAALSGISGIGHTLLGIGFIWTMLKIKKLSELKIIKES